MHAVTVVALEGPERLVTQDVKAPQPAPGELLIEVRALAPSFPDLLMCEGRYQFQPDLPFIPGSDIAGIVRTAPAGSRFTPMDRVAAFLDFGGAAELTCAPEDRVFPLPDSISFTSGAALPLNYLTAHYALVRRGALKPGDHLLVHGAAGGVGLATVQIATTLGAHVIAVVSSDERAAVALSAGAEHAVRREDLPGAVRDLTGGRGVDVILDVVGGDVTDSLRCLAPFGRLLVVGFTSGTIPTVKLNRLLLTNTDVRGVEWGYMLDNGLAQAQWAELLELARQGRIAPLVTDAGSLDDFGPALVALKERRVLGRQVLRVEPRVAVGG